MKIYELLIEAIIKTDLGPIIRAQNRLQIENHLIKSGRRELRAIILPNQIWFTDSSHMIHYEMGGYLKKHTPIDINAGAGAFIHDQVGKDWGERALLGIKTQIKIQGNLTLTPAEYGYDNYKKIDNYPILKRFNFIMLDKYGKIKN